MTDKSIMPFGKHKGKSLDQVPRTYFVWLFEQEGAIEKNGELYDWFTHGQMQTAKVEEINLDIEEERILTSMPTPFRKWWQAQYGRNLRQAGSQFFLPYLRVATAAWTAASEQLAEENRAPAPKTDLVPKPAPAKTTFATKPAPTIVLPPPENLDEDVPF